MGSTFKGLRYPEPTAEARTLHTQIKNLADDTNGILVGHDARFAALDTKTNATNTMLSARGAPQWRYGRSAGVLTNSPNDGVSRTISIHENQFYVHPSANCLVVSIWQSAIGASGGASAGTWEALVNFNSTGWQPITGTTIRVHNQGNTQLDMGFHVTGVFDVRAYRNLPGSIATNYTNDAASVGWTTHGFMMWSVTSLT